MWKTKKAFQVRNHLHFSWSCRWQHALKEKKEIVSSRKPKLYSFFPCQLALNTTQSLLHVFPTDLSMYVYVLCFTVRHFEYNTKINISVEKYWLRGNRPNNWERAQQPSPYLPISHSFLSWLSLLISCTKNNSPLLSRLKFLKLTNWNNCILPRD